MLFDLLGERDQNTWNTIPESDNKLNNTVSAIIKATPKQNSSAFSQHLDGL
jgi:hypothetical protein